MSAPIRGHPRPLAFRDGGDRSPPKPALKARFALRRKTVDETGHAANVRLGLGFGPRSGWRLKSVVVEARASYSGSLICRWFFASLSPIATGAGPSINTRHGWPALDGRIEYREPLGTPARATRPSQTAIIARTFENDGPLLIDRLNATWVTPYRLQTACSFSPVPGFGRAPCLR